MRLLTLYRRSLTFHMRSHVAVALAALTGTAALTGALLVGDSMRGTLRAMALDRLGRIDQAVVAQRFFREALAEEMAANAGTNGSDVRTCPAIIMRGGVSHADAGTRVNRIQVLGVDERFAALSTTPLAMEFHRGADDRVVILNEPLADDLGAKVGEDVLIRIDKPGVAPGETLLGRRDDRTLALRLTVSGIVPADGLGGFSLRPWQYAPRNAFVPLAGLQRAMNRPALVNAVLVSAPQDPDGSSRPLRDAMQESISLLDLGLTIRIDSELGYFALESDQLLLPPPAEEAGMAAANAVGAPAAPVLTYLVNDIRLAGEDETASETPGVPYSTATAADLPELAHVSSFPLIDGEIPARGSDDFVLLNQWTAERLGANIGDSITLTYFVTGDFGRLDTAKVALPLAGIMGMEGAGADAGFTPPYPGVTDAKNLSDWNPPFPIDLKRIQHPDEEYWDRYHSAPKVFLPLELGQRLWTEGSARFGRLTSIRMGAAAGSDLKSTALAFERELQKTLRPERFGLALDPIREQALAASRGSTDFGGLFIGFSFFVIVAAAMLVALMFRLNVEQRAGQVGILLAAGFAPRRVRNLLLAEGALLSAIGGIGGLFAAGGYAWLMLAGLRGWWSDAVGGSFLELHFSAPSLGIGLVSGFGVAWASIAGAVRGLTRASPRALLAGNLAVSPIILSRKRGAVAKTIAGGFAMLAMGLVLASQWGGAIPETGAFFGGGAAALIACLALMSAWLGSDRHGTVNRPGFRGAVQLGIRNGTRLPGRSLLTAGLIASASFVIVAMDSMKHGPTADQQDKSSGTGGFSLLAESSIPLTADPNTPEGREQLNLTVRLDGPLASATFMPFRLRQGDESSCLNLYSPRNPRILGATDAFIERGGFAFKSSLAETDEQKRNPWTLLSGKMPDGAIPVIGDYNSVKWLMHLGLGKDLTIRDGGDKEVTLRIVGLLTGSILQGELVISESHFLELFPASDGYGFFLAEAPTSAVREAEQTLESQLAGNGFDVTGTQQRLEDYLLIEHTYISTFQMLGGLGLILGTLGMGAVLLRNVFERRGELALMRALGYRRVSLATMVLSENAALMVAGLAAGSLSALLAIGPHALSSPESVPWLSLGGTLGAVFAVGMAAGIAALVPTLRAPLLPALRSE